MEKLLLDEIGRVDSIAIEGEQTLVYTDRYRLSIFCPWRLWSGENLVASSGKGAEALQEIIGLAVTEAKLLGPLSIDIHVHLEGGWVLEVFGDNWLEPWYLSDGAGKFFTAGY